MTRVLRAVCAHATDHIVIGQLARRFAREVGFDERGASEVAISAAELVSNAVRHARVGTLELRELGAPRPGVEIIVCDEGPGIPSPDLAVVDGWSRGAPLAADARPSEGTGCGLGAVRRLTDDTEIESVPSRTIVTARRYVDSRKR